MCLQQLVVCVCFLKEEWNSWTEKSSFQKGLLSVMTGELTDSCVQHTFTAVFISAPSHFFFLASLQGVINTPAQSHIKHDGKAWAILTHFKSILPRLGEIITQSSTSQKGQQCYWQKWSYLITHNNFIYPSLTFSNVSSKRDDFYNFIWIIYSSELQKTTKTHLIFVRVSPPHTHTQLPIIFCMLL